MRFRVEGAEAPAEVDAYRLTDGGGNVLDIARVARVTSSDAEADTHARGGEPAATTSADAFELEPTTLLDPLRVHHLEIPSLDLRTLVRRDPIFRTLGSDAPLGATIDGDLTRFGLFSPRAERIRLHLWSKRTGGQAQPVVDLEPGPGGVWTAEIPGDLHGSWYDFTVDGPDDPGDRFFGTHPVHVTDPYARVVDGAFGRARVWRDGPPPTPLEAGRPKMEDVVAYEVHVQDFTDLLPETALRDGPFPALATPGLRNAAGEPIGLDHLMDLGVNVVHLMPVQQFLTYPDAAWQARFRDDPFAIEMAIDRENYQWGYRTTHAFAVHAGYRGPGEPGAERARFKALVEALHARGLAVIIDLVPNHTGENMDDREHLLNFNVLDRAYYYRMDDDLEHIGPFGNEVKSEDRPMVRRWIIDQMVHWMDVLGVDGFRIDLAGQIDRPTLIAAREALPPDTILYGEPWIPPSDPDVRANPEWSWYKADAPITFFQDEARDAIAGTPFDVVAGGWAGGDPSARDALVRALANDYAEEPRTTDGISYMDIHDNWALADRYAHHDHDGRHGVRVEAVRLAAGLLCTSVGPIVLNGGTEILRSKGLAPLEGHEADFEGGTIRFNGRHDTYNVRAPNRFVWDSLAPGNASSEMRDFWAGLLAIRASEAGAVFRVREVPSEHFQGFLPEAGSLLGYLVGGRVLVLANNGGETGVIPLPALQGEWLQVAGAGRAAPEGIGVEPGALFHEPVDRKVGPTAFEMWVRVE